MGMGSARRPLWFAAVVLLGFVAWVAADLWIPIVDGMQAWATLMETRSAAETGT